MRLAAPCNAGYGIGAAVVLRANDVGQPRDAASFATALAGRMAPFKLPHLVRVLDELPKMPTARLDAQRLPDLALG